VMRIEKQRALCVSCISFPQAKKRRTVWAYHWLDERMKQAAVHCFSIRKKLLFKGGCLAQAHSTAESRKEFARLRASRCFLRRTPWDVGTARCLEDMGFKAIASTSSGHAHANGLPDGAQTLPAVLAHLAELSAAVDIPLNADFENGFAE